MFGIQNDQTNSGHHDNQPVGDVLTAPAMDAVVADAPAAADPVATSFDAADPVAASPAPAAPAQDQQSADDLLNIKQQALSQLSPLVGHLDQSPEEKFRTTMMMIQATDDAAMIPQAYEAAQAITDEKVKAQALLDVVNEINYFTQKSA